MHNIQTYRHFQVYTGVIIFVLGLISESGLALLLLKRTDAQLFLLHILAVLAWAFGINLIQNQRAQATFHATSKRVHINKWGIGALLIGICTFPGLGALAYSIALAMGALLLNRMKSAAEEIERGQDSIQVPALDIRSVIDIFYDTDVEAKRLAVAALSRENAPEAMQLLRQLLLDPHAEIRSDASIALTNLENRLTRALNNSLQQWMADPTSQERTLHLADQYYQYACSNVLDTASQHFYFLKARDLLQQLVKLDSMKLDLWLKLARAHQQLGELKEALQVVRTALNLKQYGPDAYLLAMELAFSLHDWDGLIAFAREGSVALPGASEISESLQWWVELQTKQHGESVHG